MGKKRRQHDTNVDGSEESTESGEGYSKGSECSHFPKATNLNRLRKATKEKKWINNCFDCQKNGDNLKINDDESSNESPPLWICLQCGHVACGRGQKSHAVEHYETPRTDAHCVVIDTHQWSVWCYKCDEMVNRSPAHKKKLLEVTDLLKKWGKLNIPTPPKTRASQGQNNIPAVILGYQQTPAMDNDKKKVLSDIPKVVGLTNLGNTCFFNAVLQCLAQTPYLIRVLDDLQVPEQRFVLPGGKLKVNDEEIELPPIEGVLDPPCTFTAVLRKTLSEMQNGQQNHSSVYRPTELLNSLRKKTMQCTDGGQHDSHELLRHLLEAVRNEDVKRYQSVILKELGLSNKTKPQYVEDSVKSRVKFYGNQANAKLLGPERVFRGELVSTLQCLECEHTSSRTEPFLDLSLPVLVEKSSSPVLKKKSTRYELPHSNIPSNDLNAHKSNNTRRFVLRAKLKDRENSNASNSSSNRISEEKKGNESEESDADVEDNTETEDSSVPEVGESGYSSEKLSSLTSPVSLTELTATDQSINMHVALTENNVASSIENGTFDFTSIPTLANENGTHSNHLPSPQDVTIEDVTEIKNSKAMGLTLPTTSLVIHSNVTSPEGPTVSPLSSSITSKDTPTSPISSTIEGDDIEKMDDENLKDASIEKHESSDKEDLPKENSVTLDESPQDSKTKENSVTKKLTNGMSSITSNMTKLDLSSPVTSPKRYATKEGDCSIQLCLNQFTDLELMSGNNKVGCEACTERENKGKKEGVKMVCTDSTKQYLISRVPAVLILHLKRFQMQKYGFRKVGKHVSFPMLLDLSPVSKYCTKPIIYALYGVVEHSGTLYGGHYVAYVKSRAPLKPSDPRWSFLPTRDSFETKDSSSESNSELESEEMSGTVKPEIEPPPGRWYYVSDSRVHEVDEQRVLGSEAYLLFYERIL